LGRAKLVHSPPARHRLWAPPSVPYPSETFRVLKSNEIRHFGDYRTARLVLAAWDRFEADGTFAAMGM
jgi:hypothetical protein